MTNENECSDETTAQIEVLEIPIAAFHWELDEITPRIVQFYNTSQFGSSSQWHFMPMDSAIDNTVQIFVMDFNQYRGEVTVRLVELNDLGCGDTAWNVLNIRDKIEFFVPSSFSPNNDGLNDTWNIINDQYIAELSLTMFNRFGQIVEKIEGEKSIKLRNDLPDGVYGYYLKIKDITGKSHIHKGTIHILR